MDVVNGIVGVVRGDSPDTPICLYKSETLSPTTTQRCDVMPSASWATLYNLEVVIVLAFRLNTYEASRVRQKVLESLHQQKAIKGNLLICCVKRESIVSLTS